MQHLVQLPRFLAASVTLFWDTASNFATTFCAQSYGDAPAHQTHACVSMLRRRSLELTTVIFDCDYSLLLFAELTALTSLKASAVGKLLSSHFCVSATARTGPAVNYGPHKGKPRPSKSHMVSAVRKSEPVVPLLPFCGRHLVWQLLA